MAKPPRFLLDENIAHESLRTMALMAGSGYRCHECGRASAILCIIRHDGAGSVPHYTVGLFCKRLTCKGVALPDGQTPGGNNLTTAAMTYGEAERWAVGYVVGYRHGRHGAETPTATNNGTE